jgi:TetR/AcrR family transcriptional regulator, cholesterol catabolism regulator
MSHHAACSTPPAPKGTTRRDLARDETRRKILDAGASLFAERGWEATTLRDVAKAAGLSTGALFVSYANKAELFVEVVNADCEELVRKLDEVQTAESSAAEGILRLFAVIQRHYATRARLLEAVMTFIWRHDMRNEAARLVGLDYVRGRLRTLLRRGAEAGELVFPVGAPLTGEILLDAFFAAGRRATVEGRDEPTAQGLQMGFVQRLLAGYTPRR